MGRFCCWLPIDRGAGVGAVGREGAPGPPGPRAGAERPPRERGMMKMFFFWFFFLARENIRLFDFLDKWKSDGATEEQTLNKVEKRVD